MVVTVESCSGPRAYVGLVSTYLERITENYDRLTDERWARMLYESRPPEVPWIADLVQQP
jgi:hypothetical protein